MTEYEKFFGIAPGILLFGLSALRLGFILWTGRPVLISPRTLRRGSSLALLPLLLVVAFTTFTKQVRSASIVASLGSGVLSVLIFALIFAPFVFGPSCFFWLFNVTEDMMMDALGRALHKHRIKFSYFRRKSAFLRVGRSSQIVVNFSEMDSTIEITLTPPGWAWLLFTGKRHIEDFDSLITDFRRLLETKDYFGSLAISFWVVSAGVAATGIFTYALIETFFS